MAYPYPSQRGRRPTEEERARWSSRPPHILRRMRNIRPENRCWGMSLSGMDRRDLANWMGKLAMHRDPARRAFTKWSREDSRVFVDRILEKIREARADAVRWGWKLPGSEPDATPAGAVVAARSGATAGETALHLEAAE